MMLPEEVETRYDLQHVLPGGAALGKAYVCQDILGNPVLIEVWDICLMIHGASMKNTNWIVML